MFRNSTSSGRVTRRGLLQGAAAGGLLLGANGLPMPARAAPKKGGMLRIGKAHGQTTDTLDPATYENGFTNAISHAVHGRMTEVGADGQLKPEVAESWEASDDASVWRFKLRSGMTFHNGAPVTVADVVASINYHRGEDSTSAAGPIVKPIKDVGVDGDVIVFTLDGGNADFPFILSDYHLTICPADGDSIDWKSGVGCGSYKLVEFNPGVIARFEKFADHWDADNRAWIEQIEMLSIIDQNARTTALVSGDVHAIDRLDLKTAGLMGRRKGVNIHSVSGTQHYTFAMSSNQDPYTDVNVRLALKYGVNRQEMVDKILFGYGALGNDHPIGSGQRYFNQDLAQREYDPDRAKFHLKEAGLDSVSVALSASDAAFGGAVDAAVLFQASAKSAGIELEPVREPKDGYWSDVWMKKPFSAVYWGGRPVEDQMFATAYQCGAAWNDSFWCNDRFEELLVSARAELDQDKRRAMYYEMQEIVSNDGGVIIPMFASYVFATNDDVGIPDQFGSNWDMDGERWTERWWMA
ncbi:MAG: ABC transporter substrate-binding protein [Pseudomonadota bacterium]